MNRKLLFLVNPISGVKKKPALMAAIQQETQKAGLDFEIAPTNAAGDYRYLREEIAAKKITDVIICGGDGSVSSVTSFLLETDVAVGIIPMGSGNGLALAAGIPYSTAKALDIIYGGYSAPVDGFRINGKFSCMMCGIGNDAKVAHEFARQRRRGLATYLKLSALNYFQSGSFPFDILLGGGRYRLDAYFIVIANSNQFGNHVTIAPRASLSDGLLDIVIVRKMNKLVLPFALLNQIAGQNLPQENVALLNKTFRDTGNILYVQASEVTIINRGDAPLHIDGEPQPLQHQVECSVLPRAFRLLQPLPRPANH